MDWGFVILNFLSFLLRSLSIYLFYFIYWLYHSDDDLHQMAFLMYPSFRREGVEWLLARGKWKVYKMVKPATLYGLDLLALKKDRRQSS